MRFLTRFIGTLIALASIAVLAVGGYFLIRRFATLFTHLDLPLAMTIASVAITALVVAMILGGSIRRAARRNAEAQRRADKATAYKLFVSFWQEQFREDGSEEESADQRSEQMQELGLLLLLHGCSAAVKAHAAMQSLPLAEAQEQFSGALLAIRKDLGLETRGLSGDDLARLLSVNPVPARSAWPLQLNQDSRPRVSLSSN